MSRLCASVGPSRPSHIRLNKATVPFCPSPFAKTVKNRGFCLHRSKNGRTDGFLPARTGSWLARNGKVPAQIEFSSHGGKMAARNDFCPHGGKDSPHGSVSRVWKPIFVRTEGLWLPPKASGSCARPI